MKDELIDKCHFFREKFTTCHIVCLYHADEWEKSFLIEVKDGKEILRVIGTLEGRSQITKFMPPTPDYEEIKKQDVCTTELFKIIEIIGEILK